MIGLAQIRWWGVFSTAILVFAGSAFADEQGARAASPLFQDEGLIELTLRTNLSQLVRDRDKSYHSGTLQVTDSSNRTSEFPIRVGTRGMTSLQACAFPFIRFKFDSAQVKGTVFENLNKVKVVTHCDRSDAGDSRANEQKEVILQYALYRVYQLFTDYSLKVRLARIHYEDTAKKVRPFTKYAFFIEPEESVAARHGARAFDRRRLNDEGYSANQLNGNFAGLVAVFEFMVGNGDWHLLDGDAVSLLNAVAIGNDDIKILTMPYDLDRSGMVNGEFAYHSIYSNGHTFPIVGDSVDTIRDIYRKSYRGHSLYRFAFSRIREKREEIYDVYRSMESLIDPRYRNRTIGHLDRFFEAIGTREEPGIPEIQDELPTRVIDARL